MRLFGSNASFGSDKEEAMKKRVRELSILFIAVALIFSSLFLSSYAFGFESEQTGILNGIIQANGANWVAKENVISILPDTERKKRLGAIVDMKATSLKRSSSLNTGITLPSQFDWRNHNGINYVTPVKNQGNCGSCWVFSSVGVMESRVLMDYQMGGLKKDLSEQIMLTFTKPFTDPQTPYDNCEYGGYIDDAAAFLKTAGIPVEGCYPYTQTDGSSNYACSDWQSDTYKITGWTWVNEYTTATANQIKTAIYNYGPIVVTMSVYDDFFSYSSGIYKYVSGSVAGGHALELIGWDDINQCFIVKNSWGTGWGESGFFRIAYSEMSSVVGFASQALAYASSTMSSTTAPLADFYIKTPDTGGKMTAAGNAPFTVTFQDTSTSATPLISWFWDFGDGATSTAQNPTHTYASGGTYTVSLEVGNSVGLATATSTNMITVTGSVPSPPVAHIAAAPTSGQAPLPVQFTGSTTGGSVNSWTWYFGDGSTSSSQSSTHTYTNPGTYTVTLVAAGPGGSNTTTTIITVSTPSTVVSITASPTGGLAPLPVQFTGSCSAGPVNSWAWSFGDGSTSTSQTPAHTYANPGTYTVTLVASLSKQSGSTTATIHVNAPPPAAKIAATPTGGQAPLAVQFNGTTTGGPVNTWAWSFGDSSTSSSQNPNHTYTNPGTYTVTLNASGPGGTSIATATITASPAAPIVNINANPTSGQASLTVHFTATNTGGSVNSWSWTFGDGSTSGSQSPSHTYTQPGTYSAALTASGPGGTSTKTVLITVNPPSAPVVSTKATSTSGKIPLQVQFTATNTGGPVTAWSWSFGDGSTSTLQNPRYTYTVAGIYPATLTASGPGGTSVRTITITANAPAPVAAFTATPTVGSAPLDVQFTNRSTGTISSFYWDFGDGSTSSVQSPQHTYAQPGSYTARLTVAGPGGSASRQLSIAVRVRKAVADFQVSQISGSSPLTAQFTDTSTGQVTSRLWNFGDGRISRQQNPTHTYTKKGKYTVRLTTHNAAGSSTKKVAGMITVK